MEDTTKDKTESIYRHKLRRWLARSIAMHLAEGQRDSMIANELLGILPDFVGDVHFANFIPSIVIIRSSHPQQEELG